MLRTDLTSSLTKNGSNKWGLQPDIFDLPPNETTEKLAKHVSNGRKTTQEVEQTKRIVKHNWSLHLLSTSERPMCFCLHLRNLYAGISHFRWKDSNIFRLPSVP